MDEPEDKPLADGPRPAPCSTPPGQPKPSAAAAFPLLAAGLVAAAFAAIGPITSYYRSLAKEQAAVTGRRQDDAPRPPAAEPARAPGIPPAPKAAAPLGDSTKLASGDPSAADAAPEAVPVEDLVPLTPQLAPQAGPPPRTQTAQVRSAPKSVPAPRLRRLRSPFSGRRPSLAPAGHGSAAELLGDGAIGSLPPGLQALALRELGTHPESIPTLLRLWRYAQVDDQTGAFSEAMKLCGSLYGCERSGKWAVFVLSSGLRIQEAYDRSRPWGQRNEFVVTAPSGESAQLWASPLVFDLGGRGIGTDARLVAYDIDGDGRPELLHGLRPGCGILAFDRDRDGVSGSDGRELFGDATDLDDDGKPDGYPDGFEALWAFAAKAVREGVLPDGALAAARLGPSELRRLERAYGLELRLGGLPGAAEGLAGAGVAGIRLSRKPSRRTEDFDARGDAASTRDGAVFERAGGGTGAYADVWFAARLQPPALRP
ncbi:MAG: hypothetical protein HY927_11830 [Elusimicrobia bacterium]|nr:hypothetical protein [Elusimicrobiota bacterium]